MAGEFERLFEAQEFGFYLADDGTPFENEKEQRVLQAIDECRRAGVPEKMISEILDGGTCDC